MKKVLSVFLMVVSGMLLCGTAHAFETYIPHITGGYAEWDDYLQINNNTPNEASYTLTLYGSGLQVYSQAFSIAGFSSSEILLKNLNAYAETGVITYTESGLNFRVSYENRNGGVAEFKTIDTLDSAIGFYFSSFMSSVADKGAALANMGTSPADVTLYALAQGSIQGTVSITMQPKTKVIGTYTTWFPELGFDQVEWIVADSSSTSFCGIAISWDSGLSHLLFTPAAPVTHFSSPEESCGAFIAPGVWKAFDCYNLAAVGKTTEDDPFTPTWRLNGGYWQWGRKGPDSSQWYTTSTANFAHGPTGPDASDANPGEISGWDTTSAPDGSWTDAYKTPSDPCPSGFRVPTVSQWNGLLENNAQRSVGSWSDTATNYDSARFFGDKLMLPAAGRRHHLDGSLYYRGGYGHYWSSSQTAGDTPWDANSGFNMYFWRIKDYTSSIFRIHGLSVRCISE